MSELGSAIDALRAEALSELPDARIEADFAELQRASELLEAERLRRLAEIDRRGLYVRDGHLSTASWLASTHRMGWGGARTSVRVARALEQMSRTRRALECGDVSLGAVRMLVAARGVHPEAFAEAEPLLVAAASRYPLGELHRVLQVWRDRVEAEHEPGVDPRVARRHLHASMTLGGMVRVDGDLDPATGESLLTALGAVLDAEVRGTGGDGAPDDRTPAQRRADALGEVCRGFLDRADRPVVAGERPHLTVTVPVEVLAGSTGGASGSPDGVAGPGGAAELDHAGTLDVATTRQLACDASVMRVVLGLAPSPWTWAGVPRRCPRRSVGR